VPSGVSVGTDADLVSRDVSVSHRPSGGAARADGARPWPEAVVRDAIDAAHDAIAHVTEEHVDRSPVVASILRAGARNLLQISHAAP
jgi:hypothetical protein